MTIETIDFIEKELKYLKDNDHDCHLPYDPCITCSRIAQALEELEQQRKIELAK